MENILNIAQYKFPSIIIMKLNKQIKRKLYEQTKTTLNNEKSSKKWFSLPYCNDISNNKKETIKINNKNNINITTVTKYKLVKNPKCLIL